MFTALLIFQVLLAAAVIGLVLLQQGKGADMGAAFGAGASGTVFGSRGSGSFFSRATAVLAALFFINSVILSSPLVRDTRDTGSSVTERVPVVEEVLVTDELPASEAPADTDLPPADLPVVPEAPVSDLPPAEAPVVEDAGKPDTSDAPAADTPE